MPAAIDPEREPTEFGWWFMGKLEEHDLSQSELARLTGNEVTQPTISRWIFGKGQPEPAKLRIVAPFIGVDYDEMLERSGHRKATGEIPTPAPAETITPLAARVNRLSGPHSPLDDQARNDFERLVTGLLIQFEPAKRSSRRPA